MGSRYSTDRWEIRSNPKGISMRKALEDFLARVIEGRKEVPQYLIDRCEHFACGNGCYKDATGDHSDGGKPAR